MLLFQKAFHAGLQSGEITLTFRRWDKPRVKPGGRYRCHPIGVLEVDGVEQIRAREITEDDARRAGFGSRAELISYLEQFGGPLRPESPVYRVALHHAGDGDRVQGAMDAALSADEVETLREKLRKLDERSEHGEWTKKTLRLIREHPRIAASKLAARVKRETAPFKADVVKLKKLGLTQSFEVGYELSPRGRAFLEKSRGRW